jgi:hypothetical protein
MKTFEFKVSIDLTNSSEVQALNEFINTLGGISPSLVEANAPVTEKPVTVKKKTPKQTEPEEPEEPEEPVAQESPSLLPEETSSEKETTSSAVDLLTLRKLVMEKSGQHRDAMKAKLEALGAANVSSLPETSYDVFLKFLKSLK